jgi:hypothetical protein
MGLSTVVMAVKIDSSFNSFIAKLYDSNLNVAYLQ